MLIKYLVLTCLLMLCGCADNKSKETKNKTLSDSTEISVSNNEMFKNLFKDYNSAVSLSIDPKEYSIENERIELRYTIKNIDNYRIFAGHEFSLDYWDGDKWIDYPIGLSIIDVRRMINKGDSANFKYNLSAEEFKVGKYRIIKDVTVILTEGAAEDHFKLYSEFFIK